MIYQDIEDLRDAVSAENNAITRFEMSVFNGDYIAGNVTQQYLESLDQARNDGAKTPQGDDELTNLDMHNMTSDTNG